jgi:hypothetical protein
MTQSANLTQCDKKGSEVSLYLNTGTCSTPVWIYHKGVVGDLNLSETENENEQSNRDPVQLVRQYTEDKIDLEISGEQVVDQDYEGCAFINAMRSGGSAKDVCFLTGYMSEVGNVGWRGYFRNFDRSVSGPESGPARQTFRLKPSACVLAECKVRPVEVAMADAIADYSPQTFTPTA